jgi:hypothetical protein
MAKLVYWSINTGNDANDGLTITTPVRTLTRALVVAVDGDRILVAAGTYPRSVLLSGEGTFNIGDAVQITPHQRGRVTFDFEGFNVTGTSYLASSRVIQVVGIHMRNMLSGKFAFGLSGGSPLVHLIDCVFYQEGGFVGVGGGASGNTVEMVVENCSFSGVGLGVSGPVSRNCYFVNVTTPKSGGTGNFNAFPGNTEPNGINTNNPNSNPGFRDVAARDFRLSTANLTAFELFMTSGENLNQIGATGAHGPWWDPRWLQSRYIAPNPVPGSGMPGSWANDAAYQDPGGAGSTGTIVEDTGDFEPIVDLLANPAALSGRMYSSVWDWGTQPVEFNTTAIARFVDGPAGARLDTDDILPDKFEYRVSNSPFLATDDESAGPVWVEFQQKEDLVLTQRYQQERVTFQLNHTNSV